MRGDELIERLGRAAAVCRVPQPGGRLCWRGFGRGRPLVLLHGGHGSWLHWARNIEPLAAQARVWVPDLPGFGESDDLPLPARDPARLPALVEALAQTFAALEPGEGAPMVAGFSFGALVAACWAAQRGGVRRLALVGPAGHRGRWPRTVELADWRRGEPAQRRAALRQNLESFMLHRAQAADDTALAIHAAACESTRFRSRELSLAGGLADALDRAGRPVDLIWGEHDVTGVPGELGPALCAGRADRSWQVVPDAGHWVAWEQPQAVNAWLLAALTAAGGR